MKKEMGELMMMEMGKYKPVWTVAIIYVVIIVFLLITGLYVAVGFTSDVMSWILLILFVYFMYKQPGLENWSLLEGARKGIAFAVSTAVIGFLAWYIFKAPALAAEFKDVQSLLMTFLLYLSGQLWGGLIGGIGTVWGQRIIVKGQKDTLKKLKQKKEKK